MSVLTRSDGTLFVMQAYRELLMAPKKSLLIQELRLLASQHGHNVCLFKRSHPRIEAVFSKETGYLLGETIWHYFNKPSHLIYCEAIANSAQLILIVVKDSNVFMDKKILSSRLKEELTPLMTGEAAYRIVTYGDVTLRQKDTFGGATFKFPKQQIRSFETLDEPLFPKLPTLAEYQLQPLPLALRAEYLQRRPMWMMVLIGLLIAVIMGWWWLRPNQATQVATYPLPVIHSPYADYHHALTTPSPAVQLRRLSQQLAEFYLLPGWESSEFHWSGSQYHVLLHPKTADLLLLQNWAMQHEYQFKMQQDGVLLIGSLSLPLRKPHHKIVPIQQTLNQFLQRLNQMIVEPAVHMEDTQQHGRVKSMVVNLRLTDMTPELLMTLSNAFTQLPIVLQSVDLKMDTGLINGRIQLSIWGV